MSTPHQQLLAAIKLALRDAPTFSRVVFTRALTDAAITAETDTGTVIVTVKIAQRLVPAGKHGQLTVDDVREVKAEKPAAPAETPATPTPARTLAPSRLHLGFYADDLAKLSVGKLGELDDLISDGIVADTAALGRHPWWTVLPFSTADFLAVRKVFGEWCPVTERASDEQLDAMIVAALELDADSMPSDVAKRFQEARNAQFAAQAEALAREAAAEPVDGFVIDDAPTEAETTEPDVTRIHGLAVGDFITFVGAMSNERVEIMGVDDEGFLWRTADDDPRKRDEGECLWAEAKDLGDGRWEEIVPVVDAYRLREADAPEPEPTHDAPLRYRVLILRDSGAWSLARRGLAAWDAIKTPGAGTQSGGSNSPLVMLYTPAVGSPDVDKLLKRLAKEKRKVLDLGEVDRAVLFDHAPSNREIRKRWNAAFPDAMVDVSQWAPVEGVAAAAAAPVAAVKPVTARKPRAVKGATVGT